MRRPRLAPASGPRSEEEIDKRRVRSATSETQLVSKRAGLTPSRVTVTVGVSSSYYEKIWRERNPTPPGAEPKPLDKTAIDQIETEEQKKIRDYVAQLLPKPNDKVQEVTHLVTVMTFQHLADAVDQASQPRGQSHVLAEPIVDHIGNDRAGDGEPAGVAIDGS